MKKFAALLPILLFVGCASKSKYDTSTAEGAFKAAEEYEKDERYDDAIEHYSDVKNKHPYSKFALQAELKIADVQYLRETFSEAQISYQNFKDLHPKHPQVDYVTFRLGMSYYKQLPSTIDRDLTLAEKAIIYFDEVIQVYSQSSHAKEATEKRDDCLRMLTEKEMYIANFYLKRKIYDSALGRFEGIIQKYASSSKMQEVLFGATRSAFLSGDRERGLKYQRELLNKYPNSDEAERAKSEFKDYK